MNAEAETATARPPGGLSGLAARNAASAVVSRVASILLGLVLTPFILHRLGSTLYGLMTATSSGFEYLTLMRGGLGAAMRRHVTIRVHDGRSDEVRRHYAAGFWWGLILRVPILIAGLLAAGPLCRWIGIPAGLMADAVTGVRFLVAGAVVSDAAAIFEVGPYASGNLVGLSMVRTMGVGVRLAVVVAAFLLFRPTLGLYGAALIVVQIVILFMLAVLAQRSRVVGPVVPAPYLGDDRIRKDLFSYGGLALLGQAAAVLWVTTDNLLIGRFYGAAAVTLYSIGARWMPQIRDFLGTMTQSLTPLFTQLEATAPEKRTQAALLRTVGVTSALAVPICLVPCVLGDLFIRRWVGPEYHAAFAILVVSLAPLLLDIAFSPIWFVLLARGKIGWVSTGEMIVAVGNVAISLVLALPLKLGILGFALGNTLALLARNLLLRPLAIRKEPSVPPLGLFILPTLRAIAGGAPALILLYLARPWYGGSLVAVVGAGLVSGVLCLAGSALLAVGPASIRHLALALIPSGRNRRS